MEKSTLIGIVLGLIAVLLGMVLKGAPIENLVNPAAFIIIIVGTAASLFIGFPLSELKKFPKLIKMIFVVQKLLPREEVIALFMEWATITRREGLLALESKVDEIEDPF